MTPDTLRHFRGRALLRLIIVILGITGVALVAEASWIDVKAWLAQRLLERAWSEARDGEADARPWPWADTHPIARLTFVDRGGASFIVLAGASGRTMAFAPGHIDGTAMPGEPGNVGISGHRDTHFAILRDTKAGDRIDLETPTGARLSYRVVDTVIADERETSLLHDGRDRLTLVTCYPFDAIQPGGKLRWVVIADRARGARTSSSGTAPRPRGAV